MLLTQSRTWQLARMHPRTRLPLARPRVACPAVDARLRLVGMSRLFGEAALAHTGTHCHPQQALQALQALHTLHTLQARGD